MDRDLMLRLYDDELRRQAPFFDDQMRLERADPVVRLIGATPDPGNNCVLYSQLDEASAGTIIDREVAYFRSLGHDFEWKHHDHDRPLELPRLLLERGFQHGEPEEILAADLATWTAGGPLPPGYTVRALLGHESLDVIMQVQQAVWPDLTHDWLADSLQRERASHPDSIRFHAVWFAGQPVCVGWMRLHGRFASLFGGSTLAAHRGRGLYRALLHARLAEASRLAASFALVDAGPMSRPILKRLGFVALTGATPYWSARAGKAQDGALGADHNRD
jgi:hypothetical protein